MRIFGIILLSITLFISFNGNSAHHGDANSHQKAVLVTGSSSGLGLRMTQELSKNGFFVYAGVLHKDEMKTMNAMENVTAVQFDVRDQIEIDAAVNFVKEQGRGLYGLINNAGVAVFGPMLELPVEQLQYQIDVNVLGPFRVTQAFAPMIIESKGRIATTGSIAGILSSSMFGAYSMSKHAIEAYTDALSSEMTRFGVSVHVIEPGNYASNIGNAAKKLMSDTHYWTDDSQYKEDREGMIAGLTQVEKGPDPIDVAMAALDIMQSDQPKMRYMVTATVGQADATVRRQISKMLELNDGQVHQFDRARLIEMLDEEIAKGSKNNPAAK
ncbi:MAG: 3-hydroxybutyrate dehydrogenase [Psychromonas sp.]|jgi:3-hydroxybutyrate dehydrogenase|uniref:SDR family oxidoreductase n=1 Tax=Psychromonas sp. TaxID=1884585 RepID=UPI0039E2DE69